MTSPRDMVEPTVWVMTPTVTGNDPVFPWDWTKWVKEPRLIAQDSAITKESSGTASFKLVKRNQFPPGVPSFAQLSSVFRAGVYVLICSSVIIDDTDPINPKELPDVESYDWFGVITKTDFEIGGVGDYFGTVSAVEIGEGILDAQRITGFRQYDGSAGSVLLTVPTANLNGNGNKIIGNAIIDGAHCLFAPDLSDCGSSSVDTPEKYWTRWRLLTHIADYCIPGGCASMVVRLEDGSGVSGGSYSFSDHTSGSLAAYLDDASTPEVFDLDGLTIRGALDLLVGAGVGMGWRLELANIGGSYYWQVVVYSRSELNAGYGPPKKEPNPSGPRLLSVSYTADDNKTISIKFSEDDASRYDRVIVQGGNVLFGATLSYLDGNLDKAWNATQEASYIAAEGSARTSPQYADVYSSFTLVRPGGVGEPQRATNPGLNDTALPLLPRVDWTWNDTAKLGEAIISGSSAAVYLPGLRFASQVPWIDTKSPTTDTTEADQAVESSPVYMKPRVFRYRSTEATFPWADIVTRVEGSSFTPISESPSVDMDDRRPGVRVVYSRPHILGLDTFTGTTNGGADPAYDWREMLVTVGIPSAQRVEVTRTRSINGTEMADSEVRRTLVVRDDDLNFWCCLAGTVVGVAADNLTPVRVATNTILVNNYAAAQAYCDQLSEWGFRSHESVVIQHVNDGGTRGAWRPGKSLYQVVDGATPNATVRAISGVIASVATGWANGVVTLSTETPPQPSRMGSASPSRGGAISAELGGTVAQIVQKQGAETKKLAAQVAARPLIPAIAGGAAPAAASLYVVVGGNILPGCLTQGIQKRTDAVAGSELPIGTGGPGIAVQVATGTPPSGLPNGVGVVRQIVTNTYTYALLDSGSGYADDAALGFPINGGVTVNLDRVDGATTYRYPCIRLDS